MDDEDYDALHALRDIMATERSFHQSLRFLDHSSRNQIAALHARNISGALQVLRTWMTQERAPTTLYMNIPAGAFDLSGSFMEPVPVVPTREQIAAATETHRGVTDTQCAICQEAVTCATRIRHCGHCFHGQCIEQWFAMNPRCPVCRYDIRDFQRNPNSTINDRMLYSNSQS